MIFIILTRIDNNKVRVNVRNITHYEPRIQGGIARTIIEFGDRDNSVVVRESPETIDEMLASVSKNWVDPTELRLLTPDKVE